MRLRNLVFLLFFLLLAAPAWGGGVLKMATTTSTDNTGLLDYLAPEFTKATGIELQWVAVGTGKALALGKNCDVDVLLVHAPGAEKKYLADGFGVARREVMFNDFVIIGPKNDPAGVKGLPVSVAFKKIAAQGAAFASRGDNSGTNKKEIAIWKQLGSALPDKQAWYIQTGQGMINTINIAAERGAYTLTDRGTFIKYADNHHGNPPLVVQVEGSPELKNQYSVVLLNPARCPDIKQDLAKKWADWLASASAQKLIGDFKLLGKQLFTPNAQ